MNCSSVAASVVTVIEKSKLLNDQHVWDVLFVNQSYGSSNILNVFESVDHSSAVLTNNRTPARPDV